MVWFGSRGYTTWNGDNGLDSTYWLIVGASLIAVDDGGIVGYIVHSEKKETKVQATAPESEQPNNDQNSNDTVNAINENIPDPKDDFIVAPVPGEMKKLELVDDPVFSSLAMGK